MNDLVEKLKEQINQHPADTDLRNMLGIAVIAAKEAENFKQLYEFELKERMNIFEATLRTMSNGEWDKLRELKPDLHAYIKKAVNRTN